MTVPNSETDYRVYGVRCFCGNLWVGDKNFLCLALLEHVEQHPRSHQFNFTVTPRN